MLDRERIKKDYASFAKKKAIINSNVFQTPGSHAGLKKKNFSQRHLKYSYYSQSNSSEELDEIEELNLSKESPLMSSSQNDQDEFFQKMFKQSSG